LDEPSRTDDSTKLLGCGFEGLAGGQVKLRGPGSALRCQQAFSFLFENAQGSQVSCRA
jgi:hypothetical protein